MGYNETNRNNDEYVVVIKVIGVGGAGNNAVRHMLTKKMKGVEFWLANTDAQVLRESRHDSTLQLGSMLTKGLGAGANPEIGRKAAEESSDEIRAILKGTDMLFITAGLGGGTGTGAAPVVAKIAQDMGILTVGIVTRPFSFEGKRRNANAIEGAQELKPLVDSMIVISNDQLMQKSGNVPVQDSFKEADELLYQSVSAITDLIINPSLINLDFADVRTIMSKKGTALIGKGIASGPDKARIAAGNAISSALLESSIGGAKNAIVNITGGRTMSLFDANAAVEIVREAAGGTSETNIIFGVAIDEFLDDAMSVTVIATDFSRGEPHSLRKTAEIHEPLRFDFDLEDLDKIDEEMIKTKAKEVVVENVKIDDMQDLQISDENLLPSFLRKKNR